mmetsp:Transcript_40317/g.114430  ORF Transcript_40317/g.114430 Transcript_40317/m.114430 type:complete len:292 (+) Transcript_40317:411-1286(+)
MLPERRSRCFGTPRLGGFGPASTRSAPPSRGTSGRGAGRRPWRFSGRCAGLGCSLTSFPSMRQRALARRATFGKRPFRFSAAPPPVARSCAPTSSPTALPSPHARRRRPGRRRWRSSESCEGPRCRRTSSRSTRRSAPAAGASIGSAAWPSSRTPRAVRCGPTRCPSTRRRAVVSAARGGRALWLSRRRCGSRTSRQASSPSTPSSVLAPRARIGSCLWACSGRCMEGAWSPTPSPSTAPSARPRPVASLRLPSDCSGGCGRGGCGRMRCPGRRRSVRAVPDTHGTARCSC